VSSHPELPRRVISAVEMQHVRLVEASTKTTTRELHPRPEAHIATSVKLGERHRDGTFTVLPTIEVRVPGARSGTPPAIVVTATFELIYRLPRAVAPTQVELDTFARTNAIFNVWPYWREFIQNMFTRMTLPPLLLPLYRLRRPSDGKQKELSARKPRQLKSGTPPT